MRGGTWLSLAAVAGMTVSTNAIAQQATAICDLSPIEVPIVQPPRDLAAKALRVTFEERTLEVPIPNRPPVPKEVVLPSLTLRVDASPIVSSMVAAVEQAVARVPSSVGDKSVRLNSVRVEDGRLHLKGSIKVEKWVSMTGWGCSRDGWRITCGTREWKTRLYETSFGWQASSRVGQQTVLPTLALSNAPSSKPDRALPQQDFLLLMDGSSEGHISNDIARFFADLFTSISTGFSDWHLENLLDRSVSAEREAGVRQFLTPDEAAFVYRTHLDRAGREGARGKWQIFADTLLIDQAGSKFSTESGIPEIHLKLEQDNLEYARRVKANDPQTVTDVFYRPAFCPPAGDGGTQVRNEVRNYLERVAEKISSRGDQPFTGSAEALRDAVLQRYNNQDAVQFLLARGYIRTMEDGSLNGVLPSVRTLERAPPFAKSWDSLSTLSAFYDATPEETACIRASILRLRRSVKRLAPLDDVSHCLVSTDRTTPEQERFANDAFASAMAANAVFDTPNPAPPVSNASYRGWYYCYRNSTMCVGKENIMWWQEASHYNARGGRHKGIDLFGDDHSGGTSLSAVADGILSYSAADLNNWGHAVTIAFKKDGSEYLAVYAHLPVSARQLHGSRVRAGQIFATSGCSGNSGDGKGNCNTYCKYSGLTRTDEHLHFEILKKNGTSWEKTDPLMTIPITITWDKKRFLARCAKEDS